MSAALKPAVNYVELARSLPIRLQRFFAINPPEGLTNTEYVSASRPSRALPVAEVAKADGEEATAAVPQRILNPFQPHKNPQTGRWHPPIYSLRQQADLVKLAQKHGVEDLLPYTVKSSAVRAMKKEELGLRVQGTGVGRKVKGHAWERSLKSKLDTRRKAMLEMPQMIQDWKRLGHGRGWKKYPK